MACYANQHTFIWGSGGTNVAPPDHLRCECGAITQAGIAPLMQLQAELAASRAREDALQARVAGWEALAREKNWGYVHDERLDDLQVRVAALSEVMLDALDCLPRALCGGRPFTLDQRAEVMLAIESLKRGLAARVACGATLAASDSRAAAAPAATEPMPRCEDCGGTGHLSCDAMPADGGNRYW